LKVAWWSNQVVSLRWHHVLHVHLFWDQVRLWKEQLALFRATPSLKRDAVHDVTANAAPQYRSLKGFLELNSHLAIPDHIYVVRCLGTKIVWSHEYSLQLWYSHSHKKITESVSNQNIPYSLPPPKSFASISQWFCYIYGNKTKQDTLGVKLGSK
jgi:hypothetical protein